MFRTGASNGKILCEIWVNENNSATSRTSRPIGCGITPQGWWRTITNKAKLVALSSAEEFKEIRFRSGEKGLYKELNKSPGMRFPVKGNLWNSSHKVQLVIQVISSMYITGLLRLTMP